MAVQTRSKPVYSRVEACSCIKDKHLSVCKNHLLASLPFAVQDQLTPHFKLVSLQRGQRLNELGEPFQSVYFPIDCLISITVAMSNGTVVETGMVGNREMVGISAFLGGTEATQTESTVQIPGSAIKIDAEIMQQEFDCNRALREVLLRYTQAFIIQVSQTAACNRAHLLERRLARWLLEVHDRINSNEIRLTHEFIAIVLGVRRAGVTQAAQNLQDQELIRYSRGHIHILNQAGLEQFSCECFRTVKTECDRLLGIRRGGNN